MIDLYSKDVLMPLSFILGFGMAIATVVFCYIANKRVDDDSKNDGKVADMFSKSGAK